MLEMFVFFCLMLCINIDSVLEINQPLVLGTGLLILVVMSASMLAFHSSLMGFCAFMVVVGGVLVVFSYAVSLVPFYFKGAANKKSLLNKNHKNLNKEMEGSDRISALGILFNFTMILGSVVLMEDVLVMVESLYSEMFYFGSVWGSFTVCMGALLFLVMVFAVSLAGQHEGALIK